MTDALPATLLTAHAPERYTVSAVFTRRPSSAEVETILGPVTRAALKAGGYPTVELRVSDRRLHIDNTSLEELSGGLARLLAEQLHRIGVDAATERDRVAAESAVHNQQETDRAALVALAAAAVSFKRRSAGPWYDVSNEASPDQWTS